MKDESGRDLLTETASLDVDELDGRLREAVQRHGFGVLNVTDLRAKLAEKGIAMQEASRVYDVCNPKLAYEVLRQHPEAATLLPCRIAVYERGGVVELSTLRPTRLMGHVDASLRPIAERVEQDLAGILRDAVKG